MPVRVGSLFESDSEDEVPVKQQHSRIWHASQINRLSALLNELYESVKGEGRMDTAKWRQIPYALGMDVPSTLERLFVHENDGKIRIQDVRIDPEQVRAMVLLSIQRCYANLNATLRTTAAPIPAKVTDDIDNQDEHYYFGSDGTIKSQFDDLMMWGAQDPLAFAKAVEEFEEALLVMVYLVSSPNPLHKREIASLRYRNSSPLRNSFDSELRVPKMRDVWVEQDGSIILRSFTDETSKDTYRVLPPGCAGYLIVYLGAIRPFAETLISK